MHLLKSVYIVSLLMLASALIPSYGFPAATEPSSHSGESNLRDDSDALPLMRRYGLLRLNIEPSGSKLLIDGQFLDQDVWLISMRPGSHSLRVLKDGFKPYEKNFEISNGDRLTFNIRLESETAEDSPRLSQD